MSRRLLAVLVVPALLAAPVAVTAQEGGPTDMTEMMEEMKKRMAEVATPGEHHEALARFLGDWEVELKLVMPGVPEQSWPATAKYEWLIEDRWMSQRIVGTLMDAPYESFSILGFDNYAKNHVVATVSSSDTSMIVARGLVTDPTGKTNATYGTLDEYTTNELNKPFKAVTRVVSENEHVLEIWDLGIGDAGAKVLEFVYTGRPRSRGKRDGPGASGRAAG